MRSVDSAPTPPPRPSPAVFVCLVAAATLIVASVATRRARADCTATVVGGTMDGEVVTGWCPSRWDTYWNALYLSEESEWEDLTGSGSEHCSENNLVVRMINSAVILDIITAAHNTTSINEAKFDWLWAHVTLHSSSGYDTTCESGSAIATNDAGATSIHLGFWTKSVAYRGAVLVHEAVHDWSSHVDDDDCDNGGSCDDAFGNSNANTWTVIYYDHAIDAYRLRPSSSELLAVNFGNDICGFMPVLSEFERSDVLQKSISKLTGGFAEKPPKSQWPVTANTRASDPDWDYGGTNYEADHFFSARWGCTKICDPADYTWPKGKKACNEEYQPGNLQVNQWNKAKCVAANDVVAGGVTPAERQQAAQTFNASKKSCVPGYSDDYLHQYCSTITSSSSNVSQLDSKWQLDDEPGFDSEEALAACERSFCDAKFSSSWKATARASCYEWDDPIGCVDALCGDLTALGKAFGKTSQEYFNAVNCRRNYVEYNGSEHAYYTDPETIDHCENQYITCVNSKLHDAWLAAKENGTCNLVPTSAQWAGNYQLQAISDLSKATDYNSYKNTHPAVDISECVMQKELCEVLEDTISRWGAKLISEGYQVAPAVQEKLDRPDPPPYERLASAAHQRVRELAAIASGSVKSDISADRALKMLTRTPQASFIFADLLGMDTYFAALGAKGREAVFGRDAVRRGRTAALCMACAKTPAQEAILRQLAADKIVRERAESPATMTMLRRAARLLSQEERFTYVKRLAAATTAAQVNDVLNAIGAQVRGRSRTPQQSWPLSGVESRYAERNDKAAGHRGTAGPSR